MWVTILSFVVSAEKGLTTRNITVAPSEKINRSWNLRFTDTLHGVYLWPTSDSCYEKDVYPGDLGGVSLGAAAASWEVRGADLETQTSASPHLCQSLQKSIVTMCLKGSGMPGADNNRKQCDCLGLTSPICPLIFFQLRFPAHSQLQLLADHLNLLFKLWEFLHHRVPSKVEGIGFSIGGHRGRELSSRGERDVLVGLDAQLVWFSFITENVFSLVVMTQTGSIPYHELTGSHVGPRK